MAIACCSAICPAPSCRIIRSRKPGDRFWTPADWAWAGGLLDVLLPSLHHGVPVVARKFEKFDPEEAFALMAKARRAQRLHSADGAAHDARGAEPARASRFRSCAASRSGGESLGIEALEWGKDGLRPDHQRVLRPDRMQSGARLLRAARRARGRAPSASLCRAMSSR